MSPVKSPHHDFRFPSPVRSDNVTVPSPLFPNFSAGFSLPGPRFGPDSNLHGTIFAPRIGHLHEATVSPSHPVHVEDIFDLEQFQKDFGLEDDAKRHRHGLMTLSHSEASCSGGAPDAAGALPLGAIPAAPAPTSTPQRSSRLKRASSDNDKKNAAQNNEKRSNKKARSEPAPTLGPTPSAASRSRSVANSSPKKSRLRQPSSASRQGSSSTSSAQSSLPSSPSPSPALSTGAQSPSPTPALAQGPPPQLLRIQHPPPQGNATCSWQGCNHVGRVTDLFDHIKSRHVDPLRGPKARMHCLLGQCARRHDTLLVECWKRHYHSVHDITDVEYGCSKCKDWTVDRRSAAVRHIWEKHHVEVPPYAPAADVFVGSAWGGDVPLSAPP